MSDEELEDLHDEFEDYEDIPDTKSLPTFSFPLFSSSLTLELSQLNNTQNHGTTVWDSAKVLSLYLADSIKTPTWSVSDNNTLQIVKQKKCIELGSGCGLGGLTMAGLGYDTVVTDLPFVVDQVLRKNCEQNIWSIRQYWHTCIERIPSLSSETPLDDPKLRAEPLDWLTLYKATDPKETYIPWLNAPYDYILAADCIYASHLLEPLLLCIRLLASPTSTILVSLERRDDIVVNRFVNKAKEMGFEARMVPKKLLKTKEIGNPDIEIWKLKKKRPASKKE